MKTFQQILEYIYINRNISMLKEFIEKNGIEKINSLDVDGYTPMHWVIFKN
jgi:hypothetical protein